MPSDYTRDWDAMRDKIIGLGEQSVRKSYYPELQKRLEELERFRALLDETNELIFLLNAPSGLFIDFNDSVSRKLEYSREELLKMSVDDVIAPEKLGEMRRLLNDFMDEKQEKKHKTIETLLKKADMSLFDVEMNIGSVQFGEEFHIIMVARDITDRKMAEKDLIASKKHFQDIFNNAPIGIVHSSPEGKFYEVNSALADMLGYDSPEELVSQINKTSLQEKLYVNKGDRFRMIQEVLRDDLWHSYETQYFRKDNSVMITELFIRAVRNLDGSMKYLEGFMKDITEHYQAEQALRESENKYRDLAELLPQTVFEADEKGDFTFVNRVGFDTFGFTPRDLENGINVFQFILPRDRDKVAKNIQSVLNGEKLGGTEYVGVKKDGTKIPIIVYANIIVTKGKTVGLRGVVVDITRLKQAEDEIKASLKEKEVLLREVHHRVKNNMQIISSLLNLQKRFVDDEEAINLLQESQNRVKSMAIIHEKLYSSKDFAHINIADYICGLVTGLFNTYGVTDMQIKKVIEVEDIQMGIETAVPLGLIVSELVSNSLKYAFPEKKGEIKVKIKSEGDKYKLVVADNGVGLSSDFDLENSGTLGLMLVNGLVKQLDGTIEVDTRQGTVFNIGFKEMEYQQRLFQ